MTFIPVSTRARYGVRKYITFPRFQGARQMRLISRFRVRMWSYACQETPVSTSPRDMCCARTNIVKLHTNGEGSVHVYELLCPALHTVKVLASTGIASEHDSRVQRTRWTYRNQDGGRESRNNQLCLLCRRGHSKTGSSHECQSRGLSVKQNIYSELRDRKRESAINTYPGRVSNFE